MKRIKHGALFYLERLGYKIVEFEEDCRVSLEKIAEKWIENGRYDIIMNIRIAQAGLVPGKTRMIAKDLTYAYDFEPKILTTDDPFWSFITDKIKDIEKKTRCAPFMSAEK